jgi:hypothetical protein
VRYYSHNAICTLFVICSKRQLNDGPTASKHVAVWILYMVVFNGCMFVSYFVVQHNRMNNFKTVCWKLGDGASNPYKAITIITHPHTHARTRTQRRVLIWSTLDYACVCVDVSRNGSSVTLAPDSELNSKYCHQMQTDSVSRSSYSCSSNNKNFYL